MRTFEQYNPGALVRPVGSVSQIRSRTDGSGRRAPYGRTTMRPTSGNVTLALEFWHRGGALGALVALLVACVPAAATAGSVNEDTCRGLQAQIPVPVENVDPLVPDDSVPPDFEIQVDPVTGMASVTVGAVQCDVVTVGRNKRSNTEFVTFRVAVDDPDPDDLPEPGYADGGHAYMLWFASDNHDMVKYYRDRGGVSDQGSVYDKGLSIEMPAEGESGLLKVDAPAAPSPFEMTAMVEPLVLGPLDVAVDFWAKVPTGTMTQRPDLLHGVRLGGVNDGALKPRAGSEMDRVFCGVPRRFDGAVPFSGDSGLTGSFRIFFRDGRFTVDVDRLRQPSATSRVTCPGGR